MKFNLWIKQKFCKHDYKLFANIYGDLRNDFDNCTTLLICNKCGKRLYTRKYKEACVDYNKLLEYIYLTNDKFNVDTAQIRDAQLAAVKYNSENLHIFNKNS